MSERYELSFYSLFEHAASKLTAGEVLLASLYMEDSSFVRFNHGQIRQPGGVVQSELSLELVDGQKHVSASFSLSQNAETDRKAIDSLILTLRENLTCIPVDPHFLYSTEVNSSHNACENLLPAAEEITENILAKGSDLDLVGILAHGTISFGFANSLGQRNWFSQANFNFDWSVYSHADKAIKLSYSGFSFAEAVLHEKLEHARARLAILKQPSKTIEPGHYRVFLSPSALAEVFELLGWFSFSQKATQTRQSSLLKLVDQEACLHESIHLSENNEGGVGPKFNAKGFIKTPSVPLVAHGKFVQALTSPRSAREFEMRTDGSCADESPQSLDMAAGNLPQSKVLSNLGEGLYISNLWYMNFSDRQYCRMTGMTRFATFWVKNGQIAAPVNVMRFDESLYRILGENLVALTQEKEHILDAGTYSRRSTKSVNLPGALICQFKFTL